MALGHKDGRRSRRRAFQPTIDGRLETRVLLSTMAQIRSQTAAGGQAVVITNTFGQKFFVSVNEGTIKAFPASGGRVSFVLNGSTSNTSMEINQIIPMHSPTGGAHTFNTKLGIATNILNIASITATSGSIFAIEGYHTAVLSGPISLGSTSAVNRIALLSIMPGGSINVGGDLDTLDIVNDANFSTSPGLFVGRDLNWFEAGGDVSFTNGANMVVGRGVGQVFQFAKGSGNSGQGINVMGSLTIGTNDGISIGTNAGLFGILINGNLTGSSRLFLAGVPVSLFNPPSPISTNPLVPTVLVRGTETP
jgi:hypothetical protein